MTLFGSGKKEAPVPASELKAVAAEAAAAEAQRAPVERNGLDHLQWFLKRDFLEAGGRRTARDWKLYDFIRADAAAKRRLRYLRLVNSTVEELSTEILLRTDEDLRVELVCRQVRVEFERTDKRNFEDYVNEDRGIAEVLHPDDAWDRLYVIARLMIIDDYVQVRQRSDWRDPG